MSAVCDNANNKLLGNDNHFVPPKPVITTITKQAEISPTEKFISARRPQPNINTQSYNTVAGDSALQPRDGERVDSSYHTATGVSGRHPVVRSRAQASNESSRSGELPLCIAVGEINYRPTTESDNNSSKRVAFYWTDSDEEPLALAQRVAADEETESPLVDCASSAKVSDPATVSKDDPDVSSGMIDEEMDSSTQATEIQGNQAKKKITWKYDDNLGVRFILSSPASSDKVNSKEESSQQRRLANRITQLANHVFGLDNDDQLDTKLPSPAVSSPENEVFPSPNEPAGQPFVTVPLSRDTAQTATGYDITHIHSHANQSPVDNSSTTSPRYDRSTSPGSGHETTPYLNECDVIASRMIDPSSLLDDCSLVAEDLTPPHSVLGEDLPPLHSLVTEELSSPRGVSGLSDGQTLSLKSSQTQRESYQNATPAPEIWSPLTPRSVLQQSFGRKRERRKDIGLLTNGSLRKPVHRPKLTGDGDSVVVTEQPSVHLIASWSGDEAQPISGASDARNDLRTDNVGNGRSQRPNTLELSAVTSSLIRSTADIVITPTPAPKSCGLVNPGFVFDFPPRSESSTPTDDASGKPVPSPSLLDVLHKKYWANSSPSSTLTKKHGASEKPTLTTDTSEISLFRSRHESYCRVVDENTAQGLSLHTLPSKFSRGDGADSAMRMFGDVSNMFSTLPARRNPDHKKCIPTETETMRTETTQMARAGSAGKLTGLTTAPVTALVPNGAAATGSTKLARKFSLSPKVIRRKIIARLQQETADRAGSSESEPDDFISSVARFRNKDGGQAKKKLELEIEALEACSWLEQAGFPQYVQLFEDSQFPLDLQSVERDHSFLDDHQLQSLFRRLNILNRSVHMKLDINSKKLPYASGADEDEEEACVLSDKWHLERASGRWSHVDAVGPDTSLAKLRSCSSRDSVMTDEMTGEETGDGESPVLHTKSSSYNNRLNVNISTPGDHSPSESSSSATSPKGQQPAEVKQSKRNGSFFQRHVGSLTKRTAHKSLRRDKLTMGGGSIPPSISGPTLVNTPDMTERMQRLGCVEITPSGNKADHIYNNNNNSTKSLQQLKEACCHNFCSLDTAVTEYLLPADYVVGTFPRELLESRAPSRQNSISSTSRQQVSSPVCIHQTERLTDSSHQPTSNRLSVYDNLPLDDEPALPTGQSGSTSDTREARRELDAVLRDLLININNLDLDNEEDCRRSADLCNGDSHAVIASIQSPQTDSAIVSPLSEELSSLPATPSDSGTTCAGSPVPQSPVGGERLSSNEELTSSRDNMADEEEAADDGAMRDMLQETIWRERRDSGVGSSLTREPLERKKKTRLRWHSFVASHRPSFNSQNQHISGLSAGQLMYLKRLALLKVTSLMEQYSPSHKSGFSLQIVNRIIKKSSRPPDFSDRKVFGLPLSVVLQRTGQPLPQCILHAMRYLRKSAPDSVGLFRKSGVKSRIQKLRDDLEKDPDNVAQFDSMQAYDVADMFKQYLRELPECLVTNKMSDTFLAIYQHVPQELRLEALQACSLLLPDENREVLESLLYFLSDMASYHEENQMTASNLAMCFAPSLFNIHNRSTQSKSPKSTHKNSPGIPDQKEFQEQRSATDCLTSMIMDCKKVFRIPEDFLTQCSSSSSYMEAGEPAPLSLLGAAPDYHTHIDSCMQGLLKESKDKGWCSAPALSLVASSFEDSVDITYKKVHDNNPLRLWKCVTEVEAPPTEVLNRVLNERQKWDEDLLKWRTVEKLDAELDVFQCVCNSMAPQPSREYVILRAWKRDLAKGACALVMHSIDHEASSLGGGIRGIVLASHYLIEPCGSGRSKLTHISRVDGRGRQAKWYNCSYGSIAASNLIRVKESFNKPQTLSVHETKV